MTDERWAIVEGYKIYAVSTNGRVRNLNTGKILKHQHSARGGYYSFINLHKKGGRKNRNVHRLVAEHFLGPIEAGMVVHHKDGNRANPRLDNLEVVTIAKNNTRNVTK